ncbi:MAG: hypothetical protein V7638_2948 [Acidobacteriota bacterium]|jgi:patatin-related protein
MAEDTSFRARLEQGINALTGPSEDLWRYREAASVLTYFDYQKLQPFGEVARDSDARAELLADCEVLSTDETSRWTIRTSIRQTTLHRLFERDSIDAALAANPERPDTYTQKLFETLLKNYRERPEMLRARARFGTFEENRALHQVVEWLSGVPEFEGKLPRLDEIKERIARDQLFEPFRALVGDHFAGRRAELNQLADYVGVYDASSTSETIVRTVERVFSIQERPPLFINGPGGCGKSTLIAKFILNHTTLAEGSLFPFAYLDFDRVGLLPEEPITLLFEIMRQLTIQFPAANERYLSIANDWSARLSQQTTGQEPKSLRLENRETFIDEFATFIASLKTENHPLLLVLDTFEEIQLRSRAFADEILDFLNDLQRRVPRLRTVLSGRAEIQSRKYKFRELKIGDFDKDAAISYLAARGITDANVAQKIYTLAGGSPLVLRLAADLAKIEGVDKTGITDKWLERFQKESVEAVLYKRILGHVYEERVKHLAYPGLVLRVITPDALWQILGPACRVEIKTRKEAVELVRIMRAQLSTILTPMTGEEDVLVHRPDMRSILLMDLKSKSETDNDLAEKLNRIHTEAIKFYSRFSEPAQRAEEIYHRLALGLERQELGLRWMEGLRPFLGSSIRELPAKSQVYLAARLGLELSPELWNSAEDEDWIPYAVRFTDEMLALERPSEALALLSERQHLLERSSLRPALVALATSMISRIKNAITLGEQLKAVLVVERFFDEFTPAKRNALRDALDQSQGKPYPDTDPSLKQWRDQLLERLDKAAKEPEVVVRNVEKVKDPAPPKEVEMTASPQAEYTQEVRFAVIMYGGVSLAIYINGIAQELLRLVRSTSRSLDKLEGTERVYRRLSCLLSDPELLRKFREQIDANTEIKRPNIIDARVAESTVNTRFVVDVLSGTSAGGINAVYLAKALANDQDLDELKKLWVTEGDIGLLINDKRSVAGLHLTNQQPPQSLLNSRRMYFKLLKALQGMEKRRKSNTNFASPYIDELDLFITTTDIEGTLLPLRLSDTVVFERRHRNIFHFKYATPEATGIQRNDFLSQNDPFLAFAARCTSSFPFAFEPMRLCDIDEVLDRFPEYDDKDARQKLIDNWKSFFKSDNPGGKKIEFGTRSYTDGGVLDNKPFSFATETLLRRDAPVAVDRKLIYIEPSPEHPEDEPPRTERYQALENVKAALLDLPSYETIREDLERVMDRNELIQRVNRITYAIERDLDQSAWSRPSLEPGEWERLDLAGMVRKFGIYYIPYRRLRISSTTDELAKLVARSLSLNLESSQFTAVRHLIHAWREQRYPDYYRHPEDADAPGNGKTPPDISNRFLINFDFKYWVRRLTFLRGKIDQLYRLIRLPARDDGTGVDENKISEADKAVLERLRRLKYHKLDYSTISFERKLKIQTAISYFRCEVNELNKELRTGGRTIQSKPTAESSAAHKRFAQTIAEIKLSPDDIDNLLGLPKRDPQEMDGVVTQQEFSRLDDYEITKRARALLFEPDATQSSENAQEPELPRTELGKKFDAAGDALSELFHEEVVDKVWGRGKALLRPLDQLPEPSRRCDPLRFKDDELDEDIQAIREYLWRYFSKFDDFDQVSFPILFGTEVGESDVVDILRISPEDATSLIDERAERQKANGRQKLAGTALHHFGAFLDQVWRQNDILWGRLDGAERLITALLPEPENKKVRAQLIGEAHDAILVEELQEKSDAALQLVIMETLVKVSSGMTAKAALATIFPRLRDEQLRARLGSAIDAGLKNDKLLEFIKSSYEVNRDLDPKIVLRSIARSTQVIGKMFEDMANQHQVEGRGLAWISRLGQFFWGLVEVAVPGSLLNLLFFHWLKVIYAFEVFLIVASILLGQKDVTRFGWTALALTAALNLIVLLLGDYIRGRGRWWRLLLVLFAVALLFFATIGFGEIFGLEWKAKLFSFVTGLFQ